MAESNLFSSLQRMFSSDVLVRNIGGDELKIADVNHIQSSGKYQTNSLLDRFSRLYIYNNRNIFNPNLNYQTLRIQLYSDYEAMDTDPLIASTLDILADESTLKNDQGEVLAIRSSDERIQSILYNLYYDILNIEFNLWSWVRNLCKFGDFFLKLEISEKFGVYNVIPYTVYHIVRHEGTDKDNPTKVLFTIDPDGLAATSDPNFVPNQNKSIVTLDNYEVAHFRLLSDTNYLPYGRSYIEPARKIYKQLTLMEDAMLIHRIMRAPEKRMFFINVGAIPPNEVEQFMQKTIAGIKKTPYVDPQTGQYNLRFNMQNMMEDFYLPVRGGDSTTRIESTKGLDYDGTNDIEYLRDKMFAALKVPKAFFGYEKDLTGKCIHPDTEIRLLSGQTMRVEDIAKWYKEGKETLYTYSYDFSTDKVVPGKIVAAEKTRLNASVVEVLLDTGEKLITTPDHGFLLADGTRIDAQDLQPGDILRVIETRIEEGQEQIYQVELGGWQVITHLTLENPDTVLHKDVRNETLITVNSVRFLDEKVDTYNLEVWDKNENHNYLTGTGVVIKNSTLAAEDIRFARTVERIQRIVESELTRIGLVHLYAQGFEGESLTNFEIRLTTPSIIFEQEKVALLKEKVSLAKEMQDSKLFSSDFIYDTVFNFSEDQYSEMRNLVREDARRSFRINQIENEGNDPVITGLSFGTPHDLASLYGNRTQGDLPVGYQEKSPEGRPIVHHSVIGTHEDPVGGRDRLGVQDMKKVGISEQNKHYNQQTKIVKERFKDTFTPRKTLLFESQEPEGEKLLDESQIQEDI